MEWEINAIPETEEEVQFIEQLAAVREHGLEELDLERESVAMLVIQTGAVLIDPNIDDPVKQVDVPDCPVCETPLRQVDTEGIGSKPRGEPCGCQLEWSDVPDQYTPSPD